jgi:putative ABC transport system substrate-binding protein
MKKNIAVVTLCVMLFAVCLPAQAQQPTKIPHIGFQLDAPASSATARIEAFRQGLRELGYIEGKNIIIEWRSSEGKPERRSEIAAERSPRAPSRCIFAT